MHQLNMAVNEHWFGMYRGMKSSALRIMTLLATCTLLSWRTKVLLLPKGKDYVFGIMVAPAAHARKPANQSSRSVHGSQR